MVIDIARDTVYTPEFNDNLSLPVEDQIRVHHRKPTLELKRKLLRLDMRIVTDKTGDMKLESAGMPSRDDVLDGMVLRIDNLAYREDGREKSIVNARELLSAPVQFDALVNELYNYFIKVLNDKPNEGN